MMSRQLVSHRRVRSLALACALLPAAALAGQSDIEQGEELFKRQWVAGDRLAAGGDGLGPMFNADSCAACHRLGGVGGAGPRENNVEFLSIIGAGTPAAAINALQANAQSVHPSFTSGTSTVLLHRSGRDARYERWRLSLLGFKMKSGLDSQKAGAALGTLHERHARQPTVVDLPAAKGVPLRLTQRNTPPLFGAGLIDSISEDTLRELARQQPQQFPGVHGRVGRTDNGKLGRFGWRGQVGTLREFVVTACAMELGLQSIGHSQASDPLDPGKRLEGNDVTSAQCDALTAYVASLPVPRQQMPAALDQVVRVNNGERLFETVGCAACHMRDLGAAKGIYSDLLLHDLGPDLEDPSAANAERGFVGRVGMPRAGYGGGPIVPISETALAARREWRTPPLWGVRDSAPYLHDGRAKTLAEAIAAHGGEAEGSLNRYRQLDDLGRSNVLAFLATLTAP